MAEQGKLNLLHGLQVGFRTAGAELLALIREVVKVNVPKRVLLAQDIGITESHLSDALNGGNGKHFAVTWLPAVSRYDLEHRIAEMVAGWKGLRVIERAPLSPAEKLERLRTELRASGADVEALEARAYRREP